MVNGGSPGVDTYVDSEVLSFSSNATFGAGTTSGTFASIFDINDNLSADNSLDGFHHVTTDVTVGDRNILAGDVILTLGAFSNLDGTNVNGSDVLLFRPDQVGDFSSGVVSLLIDTSDITSLSSAVNALSLVERDITVGGTSLTAGDLLISQSDEDVLRLEVQTTGSNSTATSSTFIDASDLNIADGNNLSGLHFVSEDIVVGDITLTAGTLLTANDSGTGDRLPSVTTATTSCNGASPRPATAPRERAASFSTAATSTWTPPKNSPAASVFLTAVNTAPTFAPTGTVGFDTTAISVTEDGASAVFSVDLDDDGDLDVLSTSTRDDTVVFYANDGSENFSRQVIFNDATSLGNIQSLSAGDLDGDGDIDVLVSSNADDRIALLETTAARLSRCA